MEKASRLERVSREHALILILHHQGATFPWHRVIANREAAANAAAEGVSLAVLLASAGSWFV